MHLPLQTPPVVTGTTTRYDLMRPPAFPVTIYSESEFRAFCTQVRADVVAHRRELAARVTELHGAVSALVNYQSRLPLEIRHNPAAGVLLRNELLIDLRFAYWAAFSILNPPASVQ